MVHSKGADPSVVLALEGEMSSIGANAVIFKSNKERALVTLKDEATVRVKQRGLMHEESARHDSRGNGHEMTRSALSSEPPMHLVASSLS